MDEWIGLRVRGENKAINKAIDELRACVAQRVPMSPIHLDGDLMSVDEVAPLVLEPGGSAPRPPRGKTGATPEAWTAKHLAAAAEHLAPLGPWAPKAAVSDVLGQLAARTAAGAGDLVPQALVSCNWLLIERGLGRLCHLGLLDVPGFLVRLGVGEDVDGVRDEEFLRGLHEKLSAEEGFPDEALSDEAIASIPGLAGHEDFLRKVFGEGLTARTLLQELVVSDTAESGARRLLAAFTGQGGEVEEVVEEDPKAKGKKNEVVEKPPEFGPLSLAQVVAFFCQGRAPGDATTEEVAQIFGAEEDSEIAVDFASVQWQYFLGDPRVRRYLVRAPLKLL